jgi:hypothetical protein
VILLAAPAAGQSIEDLELRKQRTSQRQIKLGFTFLGLYETAVGLNRDRPEVTSYLLLAPGLKIGERLRLRLNFAALRNWLDRQENPWDLSDLSLQVGHLGFYRIPGAGIDLSGHARWYFPTSKGSREAGLLGQGRLTTKASRTFFDRLYVAIELNAQKYFHKYTTPSTEVAASSEAWLRSAGRDDVIDNSSSFGFGETFTVSYSTPLRGLDLSVIWGLYQNRHYQPGEDHLGSAGSSYLGVRSTGWEHSHRLVLDASFGLGALPGLREGSGLHSALKRSFVSLGYASLAPQLLEGGRSLNPFNPRFAQAYLDLMVVY